MPGDAAAVAAALRPRLRPIDLVSQPSVHIIGVGGAGMRAIARVLLQMGCHVSGSDRTATRFLDELAGLGATVHVGHSPDHIAGADVVTRSTAVGDDNPEVVAARAAGTAVHSRAEILAAIADQKSAILVAGTHGKTTTSSMLAVLLDRVGRDPSFVIGSEIGYFSAGARWSAGELMVVEADESDGTFLALPGAHAVVTSLDPDHLEFYGDGNRLNLAFEAFVEGVSGVTAVCIDDPDTAGLLDLAGVVSYGTHRHADLMIEQVVVERGATAFEVRWRGEDMGRVRVAMPGHHNALNAAAALTIALELGVSFDAAADGLAAFGGVARRFEFRGERDGISFVDDYAHLPAEVEAAIGAARAGGWNRVIAAYQPHRYSRTEMLGATFARSFRGVDQLVLSDVYPSGEQPRPGVTGRIVYDAVVEACPELDVSWQPTLDDVVAHLHGVLRPGDVCLTLGAGDLTTVPDRLLALPKSGARATRAGGPTSVAGVTMAWLEELRPELSSTVVNMGASIGPLTTYRVGGRAAALVTAGDRADLERVVVGAAANAVPLLPVGRGSNLLIADAGFPGIVVVLTGEFEHVSVEGTRVLAGAAATLPVVARLTVTHGLTGFEWAVGVPGSIGGAVAMNAGGHGSDMATSTREALVMNLDSALVTARSADELAFGYRRSSITAQELVLSATVELERGDRSEGEAALREIVRWRRENQPGGQNAGSVFTNPPGDSAGRLIDAAGCKGMQVGSATVSTKHANFIQVEPDGSADDVVALMQLVAERVLHNTGTRLVAETRLVGFDETVLAGLEDR